MKLLFWLAVGLLVWWAWRRSRSAAQQAPGTHSPEPSPTQAMVSCAHCGIHLPRNEAVAGVHGQYCSAAHRSAADDHNPD